MARPVIFTKILTTADADGISTSQTPGAAGNLTITGALATAGVATMDTQRRVLITCAGNDVARTFTIYGTTGEGVAIIETMLGSNATTTQSLLDFKTVTRVAVDAATAGAITVGTSGVGSTKWWKPNRHISPFYVSLFLDVTGTVNVDVEYTGDDPDVGPMLAASNAVIPTVFDHGTLAAKTADAVDNFNGPCRGMRLTMNSGDGTAKLTMIQAGIAGGD